MSDPQFQAKYFTANHIMVPMGGDYQYSNAHKNFKNMDKLVKYVNQRVRDKWLKVVENVS